MENELLTNPENRVETGRNPDGTFKKGFTGNPGGRPRNPLKDFSLKQFNEWSDEQKLEFLNKISPIDRWKMTEGNPRQDTDLTSDGERIQFNIINYGENNNDSTQLST